MNGQEINYRRVVRIRSIKKHNHDDENCRAYTETALEDEHYNPHRALHQNEELFDISVKVKFV